MRLVLAPYDRSFLDLSWAWLHDDEIKTLTMTPDFSRADQERFYTSLASRTDYHLWGVLLAPDRPIGVAGIKNVRSNRGEYWGYLGAKDCWGRGLGGEMLSLVEVEARKLGLTRLELVVAPNNERAIALYRKSGYRQLSSGREAILMEKSLGCP
jgi:RimJ/RimL family protein N-acetyltransferase